jgi:hypothetical protein
VGVTAWCLQGLKVKAAQSIIPNDEDPAALFNQTFGRFDELVIEFCPGALGCNSKSFEAMIIFVWS